MDEIALDAKEKMGKSVDSLRDQLVTLRTGRANAAILNGIMVDYYGEPTPIYQMSSISVPEPRQLLIKPFDKNDVKAVVAALHASDLGLTPLNEGIQVRLNFPPLTEDRRKELAKQAHRYGEDAKVAVRNIRRDYMELVKGDDEMSEDLQKRVQEDIQKVTDEATKEIENLFAQKEKDIMSI